MADSTLPSWTLIKCSDFEGARRGHTSELCAKTRRRQLEIACLDAVAGAVSRSGKRINLSENPSSYVYSGFGRMLETLIAVGIGFAPLLATNLGKQERKSSVTGLGIISPFGKPVRRVFPRIV